MTSPATGAGDGGGQVSGDQGGTVQPDGQQAGGQGGTNQGAGQKQAKGSDNGLYAQYLEGIPAQLHGTVTEAFKKWDADTTRNQQSVRSQYAPYQSLIDSGADPQQLTAAHEMLGWLQEDPSAGLKLIAQELGVDVASLVEGDGQQQPGMGAPGDEGQAGAGDLQGGEQIPSWFSPIQQQFEQTSQLVQTMAQAMVEQHQSQQEESTIDALEQQLDQALSAAGIQEGDEAAEEYILGLLSLSDENTPPEQAIEQAIQKWQALGQRMGAQQAGAQIPRQLGGGGGLPTQQVDPATLGTDTKARKAMAVQRAMELMKQQG